MSIVNDNSAAPGLFVPYKGAQTKTYKDILESSSAQIAVKRMLRRLFDLDLSKVEIDGFLYGPAKDMVIAVWDENEDIVREVEVSTTWGGGIYVRPRAGQKISDAIRRDVIGTLEKAWMASLGYDEGFPCSTSARVGEADEISITVSPLL